MTITVRAIYEHGVLRPVEPLALPEGEAVDVTIATTQAAMSTLRARLLTRKITRDESRPPSPCTRFTPSWRRLQGCRRGTTFPTRSTPTEKQPANDFRSQN